MSDERNSDMKKEESKREDWQLSPDGWIMLLGGEINTFVMKFVMIGVLIASSLIVVIGIMVTIFDFPLYYTIFLIFGLCLIFIFVLIRRSFQNTLESIIRLRENIISGELANEKINEKIQSEWKAYMKKYYRKYLENSEMTKEEEEPRDQKENHQVPQSDISHIKESLQEIKDMLEGTKIFSVLATLGSFLIAIGLFMISLCITLLLSKDYYASSIVLIYGTLILISGGLMLSSAEPYIEALKEHWHDNNLFRWAIYFFGIANLILYLSILVVRFLF